MRPPVREDRPEHGAQSVDAVGHQIGSITRQLGKLHDQLVGAHLDVVGARPSTTAQATLCVVRRLRW